MQKRKLGTSRLDVSPICLGCMSFGDPKRGDHRWTLNEERSRPIIRHALEAGINFFDTANIYSDGSSEEILGKVLKEHASRDEVVIATKVNGRMGSGVDDAGLSRGAIMKQVDASLRRLGVDHIDLYQIHRLDPDVSMEETLEALDEVVKAGKARHVGASSMFAWQFATMLHLSDRNGWVRFLSMQNYLNLLYREEEREMLPLCRAEGVAVLPWSPLARGRLARPVDVETDRSRGDAYAHRLYDATVDADGRVISAVQRIASQRGVPMAQIALAWVCAAAGVTSPIVGATSLGQIDDAVSAVGIDLSAAEIEALEADYAVHAVVGIS
jgi:aryl-alcohol dehydrogenase-like predicted oxidoreductase